MKFPLIKVFQYKKFHFNSISRSGISTENESVASAAVVGSAPAPIYANAFLLFIFSQSIPMIRPLIVIVSKIAERGTVMRIIKLNLFPVPVRYR